MIPRRLTPELMDDPGVARDELARSLAYIRGVNRWLGGSRALLRHLARWSAGWKPGEIITLLDIATGSADIPIAVRRWALRRGFDVRITGIDLHETTLAIARERVDAASRADARIGAGITLVRADARRLVEEFGAASFDYAHASLFLHHLPDIEVMTVLRIMDRVSRRGVVWNDLVRSRLHRALAAMLTVGASSIVKHDARVSVEAGFTKREALDMTRRLGMNYIRVYGAPGWYRFTAAGERS